MPKVSPTLVALVLCLVLSIAVTIRLASTPEAPVATREECFDIGGQPIVAAERPDRVVYCVLDRPR